MADVENQVVDTATTSGVGRRLVLRTVFHGAYLLLDAGCLLYAVVVMLPKVQGEDLNPLLRDMKDFTPAFFTNWNFTCTMYLIGLHARVTRDDLEYYPKVFHLYTRLLFHGFYCAGSLFVYLHGVRMLVDVSDRRPDHPEFTLMVDMSPWYLTNWNFYIIMEELWRDSNIFYNLLCFLITENEKLFDRSDAKLYWRTVFHLFSFLHHGYIGLFAMDIDLKSHPSPDIKSLYTFRTAYLTGWNFTFQVTFLALSLVYDVLEWVEHSEGELARRVKYWRDIIFCSMVVPYTAFVSSMFWMVYSIDRELVFPKVYDEVVPWWFNHCVHTNTAVMVVLETLLQARPRPANRLIEEILYWTVALLYGVVYYTIYFTTNRWLYKVFGVMTWWQVCLYQLYIWLSSYLVYRLQFPINRLIHGCDEAVEEEKDIQRISEADTLEQDDESKIKYGDGRWSLKLRSIKGQMEGTRL